MKIALPPPSKKVNRTINTLVIGAVVLIVIFHKHVLSFLGTLLLLGMLAIVPLVMLGNFFGVAKRSGLTDDDMDPRGEANDHRITDNVHFD